MRRKPFSHLSWFSAVCFVGSVAMADIAPANTKIRAMPTPGRGIEADRPPTPTLKYAPTPANGKMVEVSLAQGSTVAPGDTLVLKGTSFRAVYEGLKERTPCATPTNCGSGYTPPAPSFKVTGCQKTPCEYVVMQTANHSFDPPLPVRIESPATCLSDTGLRPEERRFCYRNFVVTPKVMKDCDVHPAGVGRDLCLSMVRGPEANTPELCRRRTEDNLEKAGCFRVAATKNNSAALCSEISEGERNERDHCYSELGIKQTNMDLCLKIDGENVFLLEECVKAALAGPNKAYRTEKYCQSIKSGPARDFCLAHSVPYRNSATPCAGISDSTALRSCTIALAHKTNDESICTKMDGSAIREECCRGITGGCKKGR